MADNFLRNAFEPGNLFASTIFPIILLKSERPLHLDTLGICPAGPFLTPSLHTPRGLVWSYVREVPGSNFGWIIGYLG